MNKYLPTIGLEIHAELKTKTKMFCDSKNDTEEDRPNVNICPVCTGQPGTLPVINKEAVRQILRIGTAVNGQLADYTEFDRKNYFYPDIPKGYQISQYKHPLVRGGEMLGIKLVRVHLEEDTARSTHDRGEESLIDFNRAGVPLMELVTGPVIHDGATASRFAKELQLLLRYLEASEANMEKGEMRVEANISLSEKKGKLGTKVEIKNLNSFKAVERAINYEIARQTTLLDRGEAVKQETRGWDENKEETFAQRTKEESHDYRYFPDPDLPKIFVSRIPEFDPILLRESLPELPWQKRERYVAKLGLSDDAAELYTSDFDRGQYMDRIANSISDENLLKLASNYISTNPNVTKVHPQSFIATMRLVVEGGVTSTNAKVILEEFEGKDGDPIKFAIENNLIQIGDEAHLKGIAKKVIEENPVAVNEYRVGKLASIQFLVGKAMKESGGSANPQIIKKIFEELLKK